MTIPFPYRLIGMVHLLPLPGAPGYGGALNAVFDRAASDARAFERAGFDAVLIENYGDVPFRKSEVDPVTVAAMTEAVVAVRGAVQLPFGVQVLRNDARAALSIAAVTGAAFIRVNVHSGVMVTDQGTIEGRADETLRLRCALGTNVQIFADVFVKHARPLGTLSIEEAAADTVDRGLADALIVSGAITGGPVDEDELRRVKQSTHVPVLAGSGATAETLPALLRIADGIIVGTGVKAGNVTTAPVDLDQARRFAAAAKG